MIDLVIFDLDGTLVNSLDDLADSVNTVLARHGYPGHGIEEYRRFVGNGTLKLIERALPADQLEEDIIKTVHSEFSELYSANCLNKTAPYDGIAQVVEIIRAKNIKTAVASNKTDAFAKKIVTELFGEGMFDMVIGQTDVFPKKPEPDVIFHIMDKLGARPEKTIYVGDSDVDVLTGHNAGLPVCGCCWGFRKREELEKAGADYLLETSYDLVKIIDKLL